ncbi:hypothetical protein [Duganella callida]|uniref:Uncharacterized protein n=1 Tax=Duganella callida TaxID=2561932 RepID=A0A4Y9RW37_9BURK|nr:hypothetical protein [Duganella callida]TFW13304.1 hypothetical protein E4L98_29335 [Duganella callida]
MTHTLAAVFETRAEANLARDELVHSGYDRDSIQIHDSGSAAGTARINDDESILGNVRRMFSDLIGREHADRHVYAEALNRGHAVLSLETASLDAAERAADLIEDFNPIDIDEHETMWRASGWVGAEAARSSYGSQQISQGAQQSAPEYHGIIPREDAVVFARSEQGSVAGGSMQRGDVGAITPPAAASVADIQRTVQRSGMRIYPRDERLAQASLDIQTGRNEDAEDDYFRSHWEKTYTGGTFQEYDPAYRHGESLAGNPGYRDKEWNDVEPELRSTWEAQNPQSSWDKFKDAVKHGWDRITK